MCRPGGRWRRIEGSRSGPSTSIPRTARSIWTTSIASSPSGPASSRSATPRTPWARSTRSPRSSGGHTAVGALTYVDAVHFAPHGPIDVQALDTDFLVCSAYKFFGPHLGALYGKAAVLDGLPAYKVRPAHDRFETGTPNFEAISGTLAAVDYLAWLGERFGGSFAADPDFTGFGAADAPAQDRDAGDPDLRDGPVREAHGRARGDPRSDRLGDHRPGAVRSTGRRLRR